MACQGFLVREACASVLVGGAGLFCLECNEVFSSEFWDVYWFGATLGSLYIEAQATLLHCWYVSFWNLLVLGWCLVSV